MIIDDNKVLSDMYKLKLTLEWYDVLVENESENAVEAYENFEPDLILLDLMMPWVNWFDILRAIKSTWENKSKIIISSNLSSEEDKDIVIGLGADKFVLKADTSPKELIVEIKSLLE